jgi:putative transposase
MNHRTPILAVCYILIMRKTFRYRLLPTPAQQRKMVQTLRECRGLYNTLLAERRDIYERTGKSPSLYSQQGRFPRIKEANPALREVHSQVLQNVAVRIDLAFKAFFRRRKAGEKPGYPRFRGANRYDSFTYPQSGFRVEGGRVFLSKIGHVKAAIHRPLEGQVKTATLRKTAAGKWFVCFSCEVEPEPLPKSSGAVGVDVGLKDIIATSAEWAGREFVKVSPAYTTQDCSCCGQRQVMPLDKRVYDCPNCGLSLDRDTNAARNIKRLGLESLGVA